MTDSERQRKEKLISREVEEVNGLTGLIRKEEEGKEERESQLRVNSSSFRSIDLNRSTSSETYSSNLVSSAIEIE